MSLALTVRAMVDAGCTAEQVAAVAAAYEAETEKKRNAKRENGAARQRRYRERNASDALQASCNASDALPPPKKERVPPTPPLQEKIPSPLIVADATIVDGLVDVNEINELAKGRKRNVELFQTVVGMWNDMAGALRLVAVRDITPTRQAAIVARSEDLVKTYEFPDVLAGWRKLMGLVRGSPFLRGELNGFRCDFDFVTRASSFTKIMEGKYEARQTSGRHR